MSGAIEWLDIIKDKSGRQLLPVIEDMRRRDNALIICSFGGDDPGAPVSAHLAGCHGGQIAAGLELLAGAAGCADIILYAAELNLGDMPERLSEKLNAAVISGPASPVLREATALYCVMDSGEIRSGNAEEDYKRTFLSYGYRGRPTLAVDAETAYQAFRLSEGLPMTKHIAFGEESEIIEAAVGAPLNAVISGAAGAKYVLAGGVWGRFIRPGELAETALEFGYQHECVKLLGEGDCVVDETAALLGASAELSCRKCVLCREGSWQLQAIFTEMTEGRAAREDIALIEDICPIISAGALCAFGKNMVSPALSAVVDCRDEVDGHIIGKSCAAGKCHGLLNYLIDPALCTGCGECLDSCPEEAIEGQDGFIHMVEGKLCVKCGKCVPVCPEGAIKFGGEKIKVPKRLTKVGKFH